VTSNPNSPFNETRRVKNCTARLLCADEAQRLIETALHDYNCQETRDDENIGMPLVDVLTPEESSDITPGKHEIELLAEHILCQLLEVAGGTFAVKDC